MFCICRVQRQTTLARALYLVKLGVVSGIRSTSPKFQPVMVIEEEEACA